MVKTVLKKLFRVCVCGRMNAGSVTRLNMKLAEKVVKAYSSYEKQKCAESDTHQDKGENGVRITNT